MYSNGNNKLCQDDVIRITVKLNSYSYYTSGAHFTKLFMGYNPEGGGRGTHICKWYICAVQSLKIGGLGSTENRDGGGGLSERPLTEKRGGLWT